MISRPIFVLLCGIGSLAITASCVNAPPPTIIESFGNASDHSLRINVDFNSFQTFGIKTANFTPENLKKVRISVIDKLGKAHTQILTPSDNQAKFSSLPPGPVTISATALDINSIIIGAGESSAVLNEGQTVTQVIDIYPAASSAPERALQNDGSTKELPPLSQRENNGGFTLLLPTEAIKNTFQETAARVSVAFGKETLVKDVEISTSQPVTVIPFQHAPLEAPKEIRISSPDGATIPIDLTQGINGDAPNPGTANLIVVPRFHFDGTVRMASFFDPIKNSVQGFANQVTSFFLAPVVEVTFPGPGQTLRKGQNSKITWDIKNYQGNVKVHVYKGGKARKFVDSVSGSINAQLRQVEFLPNINWPDGNDYQIGIATQDDKYFDFSETFSIISGPVSTTAPSSGVSIRDITGISDVANGGGVSSGKWTGQPSHAPSRGKYVGYYSIDSYNDNYTWTIRGSGFGSTPGQVYLSDSRISNKILSWSDTAITILPKVHHTYTANSNLMVSVSTSSGKTAQFGVKAAGMIKTRGYGQCTWYVAKIRMDNRQQPPLPGAYSITGPITASYVPQRLDAFAHGNKAHVSIVLTHPTVVRETKGGQTIATYSFTLGEMNATWDEAEASTPIRFVVNETTKQIVTPIKGLSGFTVTGFQRD